jgi:hypothetical protein
MPDIWKLNSSECLEAPGAVALFFHNDYEEGKQGGVEILQQGLRIAGNGNLRLYPAPDQWMAVPKHDARRLDAAGGGLSIQCRIEEPGIRFTARLRPDGGALRLTVDLDRPLPEKWIGKAGFNLELIPGAYAGKSFSFDGGVGVFPSCVTGPGEPLPMGRGARLIVSPEDAATRLSIESLRSEIVLLDGRVCAQNGWFIVRSLIPANAVRDAIEWRITPTSIPGWKRAPVISHSQIGYHPRARKRAVIELDPLTTRPGKARLDRVDGQGKASTVRTAKLGLWGRYLHFAYALFDFSEVTEEGLYRVVYDGVESDVFPIRRAVYKDGVWQPTLETFFPVQMCHMEVRDAYRIWHGLCHMDDALQAPPGQRHFDTYVQYEETETPYAPLTHIPHLDEGGWHDAGDYDLAAGSQAYTTIGLALTWETFGLSSDQTTVDRAARRVVLHKPDGIPDIVQQVAHGVECLLSGYRAAGHSFAGIIESTITQYVHLGDAATATDNRVSADDRWAFTNRDTAREYLVCSALAAGSRVLRGFEAALADECGRTARGIWSREQSGPQSSAPNSYTPGKPEIQAVLAAAELLITTGEPSYRAYLISRAELIAENVSSLGWAMARVIHLIDDAPFAAGLRAAAALLAEEYMKNAHANPFGVPHTQEQWRAQPSEWGIAWQMLHHGMVIFYLHRAYPDLFDPDMVIDILAYVLGCHPVSAASLVTGVGARSLTSAYGINRADWSGIPGGVVSGPALIHPDYPELHDPFPFLWTQKEYVISGAASYIFCVLAADELTNKE